MAIPKRRRSKPDALDLRILASLFREGRISKTKLSAEVGLSATRCWERMRRMEDEGIIEGYHAEIRPQAVGIGLQAMISIRLARHSRKAVAAFNTYLGTLPEVLAFYHVAGADDFLAHVAVRDSDHLRDFALDSFTTRPEVARIETSLIFAFRRNPDVPVYASMT